MFALQRKIDEEKQVLPNILPCRIHHDGPVDISERYWLPEVNADEDCETVYFRGRRLKGRQVVLPEGYEGLFFLQNSSELYKFKDLHFHPGVVTTKTDKVLRTENLRDAYEDNEDEHEHEHEQEPEAIIITADSAFSEFVIWGHESVPGDDDPYVKGVQEWIAFSQKIHEPGDKKPEQLEEKN
ncbi:3'-5' exonuclease [Ascosphaera pollenicola]|nr:3'-5' exonuclease [Ascosphaera pollenicola]